MTDEHSPTGSRAGPWLAWALLGVVAGSACQLQQRQLWSAASYGALLAGAVLVLLLWSAVRRRTAWPRIWPVLPAAAVLQMATLNGAQALGLGDRVGSLLPGKEADLICVDLSRPASQPVHSPISQLVYATSRDQVTDVWVAGRHLLEAGQPTLADSSAILARAAAWGDKLRTGNG